jgi:hypothetical protein
MSKLNAKVVQHAPTKDQEYKLSDGKGLFLRVRTNGTKSWLYCFRLQGDRQTIRMTLGSIEDMPLKDARELVMKLRILKTPKLSPCSHFLKSGLSL